MIRSINCIYENPGDSHITMVFETTYCRVIRVMWLVLGWTNNRRFHYVHSHSYNSGGFIHADALLLQVTKTCIAAFSKKANWSISSRCNVAATKVATAAYKSQEFSIISQLVSIISYAATQSKSQRLELFTVKEAVLILSITTYDGLHNTLVAT